MKNDPTFKFVALAIIAGLVLAFANTGSADGPKLTDTTKVVAAAHS